MDLIEAGAILGAYWYDFFQFLWRFRIQVSSLDRGPLSLSRRIH